MDIEKEKNEFGYALEEYLKNMNGVAGVNHTTKDNFVISAGNNRFMFAFSQEMLRKELTLRTLYLAETIKNNTGLSDLDTFAFEETDAPLYSTFLRNVMMEVYRKCSANGNGIDDAIEFDRTFEGDGKYCVITLEVSPVFDKNMRHVILEDMHKAIMYGLLTEWFTLRRVPELVQLNSTLFEETLKNIKRGLMYRTKSIKRRTNPF